MPVWHASLSLQAKGRMIDDPATLERNAVAALAGVGGDREWWYWNPAAHIAHLRVALTDAEAAMIPPACGPTDDAGESGPERPRTR